MSEQVISTRGFPPSRRLAYWNEAAAAHLNPMSVRPFDTARFIGQMRRRDLGGLRAVEISCNGARVDRSARHVAQCVEPVFLVDLQLHGSSTLRQGGRQARLEPGDLAITDSTRAHQVIFQDPVSMLLLRVPAAVFRRFVGCAEDVVATRIDGNTGYGRIASRFLRDLWQSDIDSSSSAARPRIERAALELIASACMSVPKTNTDRSSLAAVHRMQAIEYIEAHLSEPALKPATVATALRISPRYLHRLFSGEPETAERYILRRRLEECAGQLGGPAHDRRHVSEIAFAGGFSTLAHFCRTFRTRYGMSPGEYREDARRRRS